MKGKLLRACILTAGMTVFFGGASCLAEDMGDSVFDLDEVVVTATRSHSTVQNVPASVSVVTEKDIEKRNIRTITEAVGMLPGVYDGRGQGMSDVGSDLTIRGYGEQDILVLYDGMPLNDAYEGGVNWHAVSIDDVAKIELVRGAASSLYGGRAVGAVINIISKNPDKNSVKVYGSYGSNRTWKRGISLSGKLNEKVSLAIGYENKRTDGYLKKYSYASKGVTDTPEGTVGTGAVPHIRSNGKRIYLLGTPGTGASKDNTLNLKVGYQFNPSQTLTYRYTHDKYKYFGHDPVSYIRDAKGNMLFKGSVLLPDGKYYNFKESDFTDYNGFRDVDIHRLNYKDETHKLYANAGFTNVKDSGYSTGPDFAKQEKGNNTHYPNKSYKMDLQKQWDINGHELIGGIDIQKDTMDYFKESLAHWGDRHSVTKVNSRMGGTNLTMSAFLQDAYEISEQWKIYAGVRLDRYKKYDGYYHDSKSDVKQAESTYTELSPKISVEYKPDHKNTYFVSYGHSFNPPTLYQMYRHDPVYGYISNPNLEPETTDTYEIGIKKKMGNKTGVSISAYHAKTKDLISAVKKGDVRQYVNISRAKRIGGEIDLQYSFNDNFSGYINYGYIKATSGSGKRIWSIPKHTLHMGLNYRKDSWDGYVEAEYVSDRNAPGEHAHGMYADDAVYTINLGANYKFEQGVMIGFAVNNVLDRDYWQWQHGAGRTYTLSLSYQM